MVGLGWILAIVIGALAGWLAGKIMHSSHGLLMDIVLGIVGAVIGNLLLVTFFGATMGGILGQLLVAVVGACLLIGIVRMFTGRGRARTLQPTRHTAISRNPAQCFAGGVAGLGQGRFQRWPLGSPPS